MSLNPGLVGLAVLDALCAGLPVVATTIDTQGLEVEYLHDGLNSVFTSRDSASFADAIERLLASPSDIEALGRGAAESGRQYSGERMAAACARGVERWQARSARFGAA